MMRVTALALALLLAPGCGKKAPPEATPPAPEEPPPAPPVPEPTPDPTPEPEAAAPATPNADLEVTVARANGTSHAGKVVRIERSTDWYGEEGWTDEANKLTVTLEGNGTEVDKTWNDIVSIDLKYGVKTDVDCMYESQYTPWMYMCVLRTTSVVKTADGKSWSAVGRNKWRFTYDDGTTEEFWVSKYPVRKQDAQEVSLDSTNPENHQLYAELQAELQTQVKGAVTRVAVTK